MWRELNRSYQIGSLDVVDVKVSRFHIGRFREGQTIIVAAVDFYCKPVANGQTRERLASGDKLFLFLTKARSDFLFNVPEGHDVFVPVPSGLRLIADGKAYGFTQQMNPGPYVADTPGNSPQREFQTVEALREAIGASAAKVAACRKQFDAAADPKDTAWILPLLKARRPVMQEGWFRRDSIAEAASARLANLHDSQSLYEALWANPAQAHNLFAGFGTPEAREFLLKRVADVSEPRDRRLGVGECDRRGRRSLPFAVRTDHGARLESAR